jgi:heme o synthase
MASVSTTRLAPPRWRRYLELTKPKVVALITFTALVGALLAKPGFVTLDSLLWGTLGIALAAACAATLNHMLDRRIDEQMTRTRGRPLPTGELTTRSALTFATLLGGAAMSILASRVICSPPCSRPCRSSVTRRSTRCG